MSETLYKTLLIKYVKIFYNIMIFPDFVIVKRVLQYCIINNTSSSLRPYGVYNVTNYSLRFIAFCKLQQVSPKRPIGRRTYGVQFPSNAVVIRNRQSHVQGPTFLSSNGSGLRAPRYIKLIGYATKIEVAAEKGAR